MIHESFKRLLKSVYFTFFLLRQYTYDLTNIVWNRSFVNKEVVYKWLIYDTPSVSWIANLHQNRDPRLSDYIYCGCNCFINTRPHHLRHGLTLFWVSCCFFTAPPNLSLIIFSRFGQSVLTNGKEGKEHWKKKKKPPSTLYIVRICFHTSCFYMVYH